MSNIVVTKQSGSLPMPAEQVDILRKTLFKGFNDDEIAFSLAVCNRTGLDPFVRQVHFTKRKNNKSNDETIVITTGIDGFRLAATRTGVYAGSDDPVFKTDDNGPLEATVTVYRIVQGIRCPFTATARWSEFYPGDALGFMWRKMPFVMLGKCAEAQALRKAFPLELSNIYSKEEMQQADDTRIVNKSKAQELTAAVQETSATPEFEAADYFEGPAEVPAEISASPGDFIFKVGKELKGKKIRMIPTKKLEGFVDWAEAQTDAHPDVIETKLACIEYLMSIAQPAEGQ